MNYFVGDPFDPFMNRHLIFCLLSISCLSGYAQTCYIMSLSTTTAVRDALHICKDVAEEDRFSYTGFDGTDYYRGLDSFYLYSKHGDESRTMLVSARRMSDKTTLTFKLWFKAKAILEPYTLIGITKRLSLKLTSVEIGSMSSTKETVPHIDTVPTVADIGAGWSAYPINHATVYSAGIFETPSLFRRNIADSIDLDLTWRKDSVYVLRHKTALSAEKIRLHETLREDKKRLNAWAYSNNRGIVSYEGKLYIIIDYPLCLPLAQSNDSFYFHIPTSFPNLKSLNLVAQRQSKPFSYGDGGNGGSLAGALVGGVAICLVEGSTRLLVDGFIRRKGRHDHTMRECYIDLNTGEAKSLDAGPDGSEDR